MQPHSLRGSGARQIDDAVQAMLRDRAAYADAWVQWLKMHAAELTSALASKSITDACRGQKFFDTNHTLACDARPSGDAFAAKDISSVNNVACTKTLFLCGLDPDNVCWIQKAASRLETKPRGADDYYLYVRATGERVPPP
ncbi:MAG: hypothetical protein ACXVDD_23955 [Polyangia bacterium]